MPGTLYIVATPIGNLEDITLRALRVLKDVDLIAAEDTRHTEALLTRYGIPTSLTSYHEHNERLKARDLVSRLEKGESIALVSDAGTPTVSDPGYRLILEAQKAGIRIVPIPGPSALTAVLSASGLPTNRFVFEGFLPVKPGQRRERLRSLAGETRTILFYEAPHRIKATLTDLREILGDREIVLAREVTKVYEEFLRGPISEVSAQLEQKKVLGEITLVVKGSDRKAQPPTEVLRAEIQRLKRKGLRVKEIAEILSETYVCPKREVYRMVLESSKRGA